MSDADKYLLELLSKRKKVVDGQAIRKWVK